MNKIYRLVWSKVRNTWVVASEIAKGHGKSSSSEGNGKLLKSLVLMALLGSFMTTGIVPAAAELTSDQQAQAQAVIEAIKNDAELSQQLAGNIRASFLGDGNGNIHLPYLGISTDVVHPKDKPAVATGGPASRWATIRKQIVKRQPSARGQRRSRTGLPSDMMQKRTISLRHWA